MFIVLDRDVDAIKKEHLSTRTFIQLIGYILVSVSDALHPGLLPALAGVASSRGSSATLYPLEISSRTPRDLSQCGRGSSRDARGQSTHRSLGGAECLRKRKPSVSQRPRRRGTPARPELQLGPVSLRHLPPSASRPVTRHLSNHPSSRGLSSRSVRSASSG